MPLPPVGGVLVKDIDPDTFGLADGTALTFANSGLTPQIGSPTYKTNAFGVHAAVKAVQGTQGCSIARPVQDDFTLYGVFSQLVGAGASGAWFGNGALIDTESAGVTNDFGVTLRANGKLTAGVGNPDTTVGGSADVAGASQVLTVVLVIRRVKATGQFRVYVNGVLDVALTNNVNSLSASANLYFFASASAGQSGGLLGRFLAYDAAHSDADRNAMTSYLGGTYATGDKVFTSKFMGYALTGILPDVMGTAKYPAYSVSGGADLSTAKYIAYGVTQRVRRGSARPQIY